MNGDVLKSKTNDLAWKQSHGLYIQRLDIEPYGAYLQLVQIFRWWVGGGWSNLNIKRITVKLVLALELLAVSLVHRQLVLRSLKNLNLVRHLQSASCETSLSAHRYRRLCPIFKLDNLLHVSVVVDDIGQPQLEDFIVSQGIERGFELEVVEKCSDLGPFKHNAKLELNLMVDLFDPDYFHEEDGNADWHRNDVSLFIRPDWRDLHVVTTLQYQQTTILFIRAIPETKTMIILPFCMANLKIAVRC